MKKLIVLSVILMAYFFTACEKEVITPYVSISGNFTQTPDPASGFWEITIPDGTVVMFAKKWVLDGTSPLFGNVDESKSYMALNNPVFDMKFGGFFGELTLSMFDEDGDELKFEGDAYVFQDFSNNTYFHFTGGTGKWEKAEGWMNSTGQINPATGVNTVVANGEVTEPK
jgi:hypothetical protein